MVQEKPAAAPVIDLTSSAPTSSAESARAVATMPSSKPTTTASSAAPKSSNGDHDWESASLYEEILDEVEAFDYSQDGESRNCSLLQSHKCRN